MLRCLPVNIHFNNQTKPQGVHIRIKGRGDTPPLHILWNRSVWGPPGQAARIYSRPTRFCGLEYVQTMRRSYLINSEHHYKQQPSEYILKCAFFGRRATLWKAVIEPGASAIAPMRRPLYILLFTFEQHGGLMYLEDSPIRVLGVR